MTADSPRQGRRRPAAKPTVEDVVDPTSTEEVKGITAGKGRATPGRRQTQPEAEERRGIFGGLTDYIQGVRAELDKVAWPDRETVLSLFRVVVVVTIAAAAVLGIIAFLFNELFAYGLNNPIIFVIFGAIVAAVVVVFSRRSSDARLTR